MERGKVPEIVAAEGEEAMIERVCSYCGVFMGYKEGEDGVTHGICNDCVPAVMAENSARTPEEKSRGRALVWLRSLIKQARVNGLKIREAANV